MGVGLCVNSIFLRISPPIAESLTMSTHLHNRTHYKGIPRGAFFTISDEHVPHLSFFCVCPVCGGTDWDELSGSSDNPSVKNGLKEDGTLIINNRNNGLAVCICSDIACESEPVRISLKEVSKKKRAALFKWDAEKRAEWARAMMEIRVLDHKE